MVSLPPLHLTSGIGTATYSSPEQRFSSNYSTSSDIFSAGLILLELLMCYYRATVIRRMFRTDMHRLTVFQQVRDDPSDLPPEIFQSYPQFVPILEAMLSKDPNTRPTAKSLLENPQFGKKSSRELLSIIAAKTEAIEAKDKRVRKAVLGQS